MLKKLFAEDRSFFKTMFAIALPVALQNLIAASLNMVDTIMIGQLGETQIASVGLANQITFLLILFLFGVSSGASIFTAQYWGKKDMTNIKRVMGIGLASSMTVALLFFLVSFPGAALILSIFSTDPEVIELGGSYLRIVAISFPMMAISFTCSSVMRSITRVKLPMFVSAGALLLNTLLNYLLIFGHFGFPALGIRGAAIATLIARSFELCVFIAVVRRPKDILYAHLRELTDVTGAYVKRFFKTVTPVVLNESIWALGVTIYVVVYGRMGTGNVAAVNIASTIDRLAMVLFFGFANAAAVMIGNQIGANNLERAQHHGMRFSLTGPFTGILMGALLILSSGAILSLYQVSETVKEGAQGILLVYGLLMPIRVFNVINIVGILRSGGDTRFSLFLDTVGVWCIGVPLVILGGLIWKLPIQWVVTLVVMEEVFKMILGVRRFLSRKWINRLTEGHETITPIPET